LNSLDIMRNSSTTDQGKNVCFHLVAKMRLYESEELAALSK